MPLDQQSVLPTVRGLPWWGAVLVAAVITAIGAAIDANNTDALGGVFKFCYLLGCVAAALMVRRRALFTAGAQPPLIAFLIGVITLYTLNADQASSGLKSLILKVLLPIANDFPWMALTFVVTLALVLARWYLTRGDADPKQRGNRTGKPSPKGTNRTAASGKGARAKESANEPSATRRRKSATKVADRSGTRPTRPATDRKPAGAATRKRPAEPRKSDTAAERPLRKRPESDKSSSAGSRADAPRRARAAGTPRPKDSDRPRRAAERRAAAEPDKRVATEPAKRRTAGAMLRAEAGERIDAVPVTDSAEDDSTQSADYPSTRSRNRG